MWFLLMDYFNYFATASFCLSRIYRDRVPRIQEARIGQGSNQYRQ
jgi:hypothetical protein